MFEDEKTFRNVRPVPFTVWIEPQGVDFRVEPGEELRVLGVSEQEGRFEVADYGERIGVYCWVGARGQVYRNDELLDDVSVWSHEPMPGEGSIRQFIEAMFGGPGGPYDRESAENTRPKLSFWQRCIDWLRG